MTEVKMTMTSYAVALLVSDGELKLRHQIYDAASDAEALGKAVAEANTTILNFSVKAYPGAAAAAPAEQPALTAADDRPVIGIAETAKPESPQKETAPAAPAEDIELEAGRFYNAQESNEVVYYFTIGLSAGNKAMIRRRIDLMADAGYINIVVIDVNDEPGLSMARDYAVYKSDTVLQLHGSTISNRWTFNNANDDTMPPPQLPPAPAEPKAKEPLTPRYIILTTGNPTAAMIDREMLLENTLANLKKDWGKKTRDGKDGEDIARKVGYPRDLPCVVDMISQRIVPVSELQALARSRSSAGPELF
jgi:hypothetical protein